MRTVGGIEDAEEVGFKEVRFVIVLLYEAIVYSGGGG